jgi:Putative Ig domain
MTDHIRTTAAIIAAAAILCGCLSQSQQKGFSGGSSDNGGGSSNHPPAIGGNPKRGVTMNQMYDFTPNASDSDGDKLTFQIQNKPAWADFDSNTGRLYGQPSLGDIGTYSNIVVSVSDGVDSVSLPAFTITVSQVSLGSVTLSWEAPTLNTDGTPLTDLAGYRIYFGKISRQYNNEITIDGPGITTYVVDNLSPDTYYFAATAINSTGMESSYSGEAVRTVN